MVPSKQHGRLALSLIADQWDCQQEGIHIRHPIGHLTSLGLIQTGILYKQQPVNVKSDKQIVRIIFHLVIPFITIQKYIVLKYTAYHISITINCAHCSIICHY